MTTRRNLWALFAVAALAIAGQTTARATTLCTGTIASFTASPCTATNFTVLFMATTGGTATVTDSHLTVTISSNNGLNDLEVNIAPDATLNDTLPSGAGGATAQYNFHYTVSFNPLETMTAAQIQIINATIGSGFGLVTGFKELNNTIQIQAGSDSTSNTTTTLHGSQSFSGLTTPVLVEDDNTIFGAGQIGNGVNAPGSVENDLTFSAASVTTPEPVTFALCGLGLLGFGLLRRKSTK